MKEMLLRPTSTLSQPGSIISDGEIRRRGKWRIFLCLNKRIFSNNTIVIDGISGSTSLVYWTTSSSMGFLSNTGEIWTSKFQFLTVKFSFYLFFKGCCYRTSFCNGTRSHYCWRSSSMYVSKYLFELILNK